MRIIRVLVALTATLLVAACSSDDEATSDTPTSTIAGRGATVGEIGKPVERTDGAYKITLVNVVDPGVCDTYGKAISPSDTGDRLLVANYLFETSDIPLKSAYLAPADFYTVTGQ